MINTNSKFLEEMIDTVREIGKNYNGLKAYLNNSEDIKQNEKEFKNEVHNLSLTLDGDLELKQNTLEALNQKFKSYYKSILLVYENSFFKNIKEYNQKLLYLMDKIIIEFEPPKSNSLVNSDANIEISTSENTNENKFSYSLEKSGSNNIFEDNSSFNGNDSEKNKEIDYFCSVCSKEDAIYLCDNCNQLFCEKCFEFINENHNSNNKCKKDLKKISDMKSQNEKGKKLFLNSLKHFIKSIMIKANYLFYNEIINSKSTEDSKIEIIKRILFKYPFLEKINDFNSEINFLKDINNILTTNYEIENLDSKSFSISDMDKRLVNLIENLFEDDPNNYKRIVENVKDINFEEDEGDYRDEDYIIKKDGERKIDQNKFNSTLENMFYYVINLIPKENVSYKKKSIAKFLINEFMKQFGIKKENIYLLFDEKKYFVNYFIKTKNFTSITDNEIKNIFQNEYEKIYEYRKIYESLGGLINKEYLDCRGNTISPNSSNNLFRGIKEYYPPYGWIGIGLKVLNIYGEKNWLEDTSKWSKWAIAYQSLSSNKIKEVLKNIVTKKGLIEVNNKKKNKNKRNYDKLIGEDIYLTPYIDIAEGYTGNISLNKKNYKIVLMAKVLIKSINETKDGNFWKLNKKDVRIYRILLKEI